MTNETKGTVSTWNLILVPAILSLAITLLRLYGELKHWPKPWFNTAAGGGAAIIGISWLPFIFGPYFAVKLARSGDRPSGNLRTILVGLLGIVMVIGGAVVAFSPPLSITRFTLGLIAAVVGAALQFFPWPSIARTLLAYGYSARIPVALVMLAAINGKWGTHYDVLPPGYSGPTTLWSEFTFIALIPQLLFWIGFTVSVGAFAGGIAAAAAVRRTPSIAPANLKTQS